MTVIGGVATFEWCPLIGWLAKTHNATTAERLLFLLIEVKAKFKKS